MKKLINNRAILIIISFFSIILGMMIATISFYQGFKTGESRFSLATSNIKNDPSVQKAVEIQKAFRLVAKSMSASVVNISTETVIKPKMNKRGGSDRFDQFFSDDFFDFFFGGPQRESIQRALGSGVIVDEDGYIISNFHVIFIEQLNKVADKIIVKLANNKEYKAKIVGYDKRSDIALLKINVKEKLDAASLGDSNDIEIGDWAIAIGNPFGLDHTFTVGVISAKGRSGIMNDSSKYENFIQTDTAINQGNSGGPLVNIMGEVIGINSAIVSPSGGSVGIGFAIPINMVKSVIKQLKEKGKMSRGYLGVNIQNLTPEIAKHFKREPNSGVLISDVLKKSIADKGGIKSGDIIIEFNGEKISDSNQLRNLVADTLPDEKVTIKVIRDSKEKSFSLKIGELPENEEGKIAKGSEPETELWLGLKINEIDPEAINKYNLDENESGVIISFVQEGGISDSAGMQAGDVINKINDNVINNMQDFNKFIKNHGKENSYLFVIKRDNRLFYLSIDNE